jgi:small subunit ribosomal protein S16
MAVKIRLTRVGKKRQPSYRVVVANSRDPRDGRYIEQIGRYDPRQEPSLVEINAERAAYWLSVGAQPSPQAKKLIEIAGGGAKPVAPKRPQNVHVVGEAAPAAESLAAMPLAAVIDLVEETAADAVVTPEESSEETP